MYKFDDKQWLEIAEEFLERYVSLFTGYIKPTKRVICALVILVFKNLGPIYRQGEGYKDS